MARVRTRKLFWTNSTSEGVVAHTVYSGQATDTSFLASVDAGSVAPLARVEMPASELVLAAGMLTEGEWQFAVCSEDQNGNFSDPYQASGWRNVPLDLTAPLPPSAGGIA
jgi:hypothetical protein